MSYETGQLFNFLLKHRVLRTEIPRSDRFKPGERSLASFYEREIGETEKAWFEDFLAGIGFMIKAYQGSVIRGLPKNATYYVLTRSGPDETPSWISPEELYQKIRRSPQEARGETKLWAFIIWMSVLSLMYTKVDRAPQQVSRYQEAEFQALDLVRTVTLFVSNVLGEVSPETDNRYIKYLDGASDAAMENRVSAMLKYLVSIGHLAYHAETEFYSQTLLGAAEMEQNYEYGLEHLMPHEEINLDTLGTIFVDETEDRVEV